MNTLTIENFFYSRASERIKARVENSKLKHVEIYKLDHKQISRIINNVRNKNNRFLICDAVIENYYKDDETGNNIKCGLLAKKELGFNSKKEILWGTDSEINDYIYDLFKELWDALPNFKINTESYLYDYIPYAKYNTYYNLLFNSSNTYPALLYGIKEDTIIENLERSKIDAFLFFYQKCKNDFLSFFLTFTNEHLSFHKLDKLILNTLFPSFIELLESHKPDSTSLGLRVQNLIKADLSLSASMIANKNSDFYRASLNRASSNYILSLEQIQKKYCFKKDNGTD